MNQFRGISRQGLALLAENRFHNNKNFYDEQKETLKQLVTIPLRQVMLDLSGNLLALDEEMNVDPVYTVSRIRRDTRYTKDKTLYRENLWVMFRRNKNIYHNCPFLWFEVSPEGYNYGIAFFTEKPSYMDAFRRLATERPDDFDAALQSVQKAGLTFCGDVYKKPKVTQGAPQFLTYLNAKNLQFFKFNKNIARLENDRIIKELRRMITTIRPMYQFMLEVHNEIAAKEK